MDMRVTFGILHKFLAISVFLFNCEWKNHHIRFVEQTLEWLVGERTGPKSIRRFWLFCGNSDGKWTPAPKTSPAQNKTKDQKRKANNNNNKEKTNDNKRNEIEKKMENCQANTASTILLYIESIEHIREPTESSNRWVETNIEPDQWKEEREKEAKKKEKKIIKDGKRDEQRRSR